MGEAHELPLSLQSKKAADVFSCGVLMFWMLTYGQFPFGDKRRDRFVD